MIFGKKYHTLNRGRLAKAIILVSDGIDLIEMYRKNFSQLDRTTNIPLNEHLTITVDNLNYCFTTKGYNLNDFHMYISTFVDGIKMASYVFRLNMDSDKNLFREWECKSANIIHYMPNQFIDLMNDWSEKVTTAYHLTLESPKKTVEETEKDTWYKEESVIQMYR